MQMTVVMVVGIVETATVLKDGVGDDQKRCYISIRAFYLNMEMKSGGLGGQ